MRFRASPCEEPDTVEVAEDRRFEAVSVSGDSGVTSTSTLCSGSLRSRQTNRTSPVSATT